MPFITPPLPFSTRSAFSITTFLPSTIPSPFQPPLPALKSPHLHPFPPFHPPTCRQRSPPTPREYRTHTAHNTYPDNAHLIATVISVLPVDIAEQHVQVTLDVSTIGLHNSHKAPGQFVQLARDVVHGRLFRKVKRKTCILTIASAPGATHFQFLVHTACDPLKLAQCRQGDTVHISSVMGAGMDCLSMVAGSADLHVFADAPQGFAMAKALIEWAEFRSASGEGANRVNHVTIYYSIPAGRALPYAHCISDWSVYGVNVVPLAGMSVMEFVGAQSSLGRKGLMGDYAVACVTAEETFESLYSALIMFGVKRGNVRKFTQEVVEKEINAWEKGENTESEDKGEEKPFGMPDDAWKDRKRDSVEEEVWQSWVKMREEMRKEFERKWVTQARVEKDAKTSEEEKKQAWAAWCAQNQEQWDQVKWDNEQWGQYWSSWRESREGWWSNGKDWAAGGAGGGGEGSRHQNHWSQQHSQEYWDWVGRGTTGKKKESWDGFSNAGGGSWDVGGSYYQGYGGSQSWGNTSSGKSDWSRYQRGGYKYEYEEPKQDGRDHNGYTGRNSSRWGSGAGQGWSEWNRNTSGRRTSSSGRSWGWNGTSRGFEDIDFYAVLGINSGASRADIKKAYRKKAMQHHPDHNPERAAEAHIKMKQIVVAWSVLKDDEKRRRYDTYGSAGL